MDFLKSLAGKKLFLKLMGLVNETVRARTFDMVSTLYTVYLSRNF